MSARYVTLKQLKRAGACSAHTDLFKHLFGTNGKVRVTQITAESLSSAFNFSWAAGNLLTPKQFGVFTDIMDDVSYSVRLRNARAKIPGYDALSVVDRDRIDSLLKVGVGVAYNRDQARAFAIAYTGPRK